MSDRAAPVGGESADEAPHQEPLQEPGSAMSGHATETLDLADRRSADLPPEIVGFHVEREIGRGGMGRVWLARQKRPVERLVAIKVLRGDRGRALVERFRSEQAALARMNHPNVATIYEAGVDARKQPYLAMEYVEGEAITRFSDRHLFGVSRRLQLFVDACSGVIHAHQKGIIHRDIKPSNVLVAGTSEPSVKVIDFGVAKAIDGTSLGDRAEETVAGHRVGTPSYMSPEQRRGDVVDTRTDVYSLGVLLFELLVGRPPISGFSDSRWPSGASESKKPSDWIEGSGVTDEEVRRRGEDVAGLSRRLRGDLDWILLKALREDPEERYASVLDLKRDVECHLRHEPILARPPSPSERVLKWIRRNQGATALGVVSLVFLLFAVFLILRFAWVADAARRDAEAEARRAQAVEQFLVEDVLSQVDRQHGMGAQTPISDVLERAEERARSAFSDDPALHSSLRNIVGKMYRTLGEYDTARQHLSAAHQTALTGLGPDHPTTLSSLVNLGILERIEGNYDAAEAALQEAYGRSMKELGLVHPTTRGAASGLAGTLRSQGELGRAREVLEPVLRAYGSDSTREDDKYLVLLNDLGLILWQAGDLEAAAETFEECLSLSTTAETAPNSSDRSLMKNLANVWADQGRPDDAAAVYGRLMEAEEADYGEHHATFHITLFNAGGIYLEQGDVESAQRVLRRLLELLQQHDPLPRRVANASERLAQAEFRLGNLDAAERLWLDAWSVLSAELPEGHEVRVRLARSLVGLYAEKEELAATERWRAQLAEEEQVASESSAAPGTPD